MMKSTYEPGERVDRYEIVRPLAEGGFACTYLARDAKSGARVVLKQPNEALLGDTTVFEHFRREREVARRLDHPNIVHTLDDGASRSAPYFVVEYIEGVSLHDLLRERGRLPVDEALAIGRQILDALTYMHGRQIVHRDLKPANVLIGPDGRVTIIDFGLALMEGARRVTWRMLTNAAGTPAYMAPEQILGKRGDVRTDIYAFSTIMYELLKGRQAFGAANEEPLVIMQQHLSGLVDALPPSVPPGLDGIIRTCMRRNPAERYQTDADLARDLDRYQELGPSDFRFPEEREEKLPNADRRLLVLAGAMTGGFILVLAAVIGVIVLAQAVA